MWSLYYAPEVYGMTLEQQLDYFADTLEKNMTIFGGNYDYFIGLTDPQAVTTYYYEFYGRGYGSPSQQRLQNATVAAEYFGGGNDGA